MNDIEDQLIGELYFVISYKELVEALPWDDSFHQILIELVKKNWVNQLQFDNQIGDFIKLLEPDFNQLEAYSYLATKKGLLEHSGF